MLKHCIAFVDITNVKAGTASHEYKRLFNAITINNNKAQHIISTEGDLHHRNYEHTMMAADHSDLCSKKNIRNRICNDNMEALSSNMSDCSVI